MRTLRQWIRVRQVRRARKIAEELEAMLEDGLEDGFDEEDVLEERERVRERAGKRFDAECPPVVLRPRTWVWWGRWAGAVAITYVGTSCLAHALRHPEMTETQRLLDFWNAMLWR